MQTTTNHTELSNEVLFQKLGNTWYIFTEIDGQTVYSTMPEGMDPKTTKLELYDVIEKHLQKVSTHRQYRGADAA